MAADQYSSPPPDTRKARMRKGMHICLYSAVGLPAAVVVGVIGWTTLAVLLVIASVAGVGYGAWRVRAAVRG